MISSVIARRFWDLLVIPVIVGLILAVAAFFLPRILEGGKRLSYTSEKPTDYSSQRLDGVTIQVNGVPTTNLFVTKVRLWNSGSVALKDVGVLFRFKPPDQNFKILTFAHTTRPELEFGDIKPTKSDDNSAKFVYALLNPNDEDIVSFLTNESIEPTVHAKAEDLRVVQVLATSPAQKSKFLWVGAIGVVASLLGALFTFWRERNTLETQVRGLNAIAD